MYVHKLKDTDKHEHFIKHLVYILTVTPCTVWGLWCSDLLPHGVPLLGDLLKFHYSFPFLAEVLVELPEVLAGCSGFPEVIPQTRPLPGIGALLNRRCYDVYYGRGASC
ncbi:hypothetical protein BHE74_00043492 [Ensete ventricosum]|nr:hypothetical protein BHE74_00043492 [Ensete ventricosum]